jgi:alkylhydroperoxidase/carboxymuconolactone decarboxylase family protein YurZ
MAKPAYIEALEKGDPELLKHFAGVQEFVSRDGALSAKIKTLMGMFGDAILGHADGVRAIAERARAQGATEQEIAETVRMAFYFGGIPALVTATNSFKRQD